MPQAKEEPVAILEEEQVEVGVGAQVRKFTLILWIGIEPSHD